MFLSERKGHWLKWFLNEINTVYFCFLLVIFFLLLHFPSPPPLNWLSSFSSAIFLPMTSWAYSPVIIIFFFFIFFIFLSFFVLFWNSINFIFDLPLAWQLHLQHHSLSKPSIPPAHMSKLSVTSLLCLIYSLLILSILVTPTENLNSVASGTISCLVEPWFDALLCTE